MNLLLVTGDESYRAECWRQVGESRGHVGKRDLYLSELPELYSEWLKRCIASTCVEPPCAVEPIYAVLFDSHRLT